ncbi:hypothetical protein H257_06524 [Aphanomyces astaci]|uniref:Kinesin-like protein n=1 Tax=Aphanomyces astaci TaxID=112090 RepID=W4GMB1_APHAT|nr:hypothetical protein H257_06524 [Aphanomyces astaci]ETV80154.1 hypothetical protein H257_06524 [Aphanomyces astaci]|eukprot:XP_009830078.1 hypothetical protein H257_06524 [Aphanomyces astaci]
MSHIHVSCRVRPQNSVERKHGGQECVKITDGKAMEISNDEGFANDYLKCTFDQVFDAHATQKEVYEATAKPLVLDLLNGYNCTVFAYGQTGSGKTHTIYGPKDGVATKPDDQGLIGRLVHDLYDHIRRRQSDQLVFEISGSFIEIYMEQINDLLQPANKNLRVRENTDKGVYVDDLLSVRTPTEESMLKLVERGNTNRVVACTRMNNDSSRSHTVLVVNMVQRDVAAATEKRATMYVVDLAGSEMVMKTLASGKTLNEAKAINKSLSALSNVIKALGDGHKHIPFRDSKLTRILQDSLGGHAKTCLIVTVSSSSYNVAETISTVRFGTRAKEIKNDPTLHEVQDASMCDYQQLYQHLVLEHAKTQQQLQELIQATANSSTRPPEPIMTHLLSPEDDDPCLQADANPHQAALEPPPPLCAVVEISVQHQASQTPPLAPPPPSTAPPPSTLARTLTSLLFADQTATRTDPAPPLGHADLVAQLSQLQEDLQMCRFEVDAMREMNHVLSAQNEACNTRTAELESALDALKEINRTISAQNTVLSDRNLELEAVDTARANLAPTDVVTVGHLPEAPNMAAISNDYVPSSALVDTLTRKLVEMKMHVHFVTEYTKSILDHEPYEIVHQLTQLKLDNERLRLEAHHHAITIKELQAKCQAMQEAVAKTDDNTASLQRTIGEYQALYKEQVRLSQERQQNLLKEVEYYKMIWQRSAPTTKRDNNQQPLFTATTSFTPSHITLPADGGTTQHSLFKAASFSGVVPVEPLSLMALKRSSNRKIVKPQSPKTGGCMHLPHTNSPIIIHANQANPDSTDANNVHVVEEDDDPLSSVFGQDVRRG